MSNQNEKVTMSSWKTTRAFMKLGSCSEATMHVINRGFGHPMENEERAVMPLAGGIAQQGFQCGGLWGATLAAGAEAHRRYGYSPLVKQTAVTIAERLTKIFQDRNKHIDCLEITETDWTRKYALLKNFVKGGPIKCFRLIGNYAPKAHKEIDESLSEAKAPSPCASCTGGCAAKLAKEVGLSDMHTTMVAGLAGGIGLSGGACGVLGAAVWINEMVNGKDDRDYNAANKRASALIDTFLKESDYTFECADIVGRKFENIADHDAYVAKGGCANIIDTLAKTIKKQSEETLAECDTESNEPPQAVVA